MSAIVCAMPDGTSWQASSLRPHLLDAACSGSTDSRKGDVHGYHPHHGRSGAFLEGRFHEGLSQALAPGTPDLLLAAVMVLIIHLTFHEDVVVTIWANKAVRAALLSAARLLDRTDGLAVDGPGRASTRLEAFTALHNLTFAQDNLAPLWQDEELRAVVVAAAAATHREDRQYQETSLKMLSNFLLEPANLAPMQQHAQACAALEAARTKGKKELLRAVNTALEKLGRLAPPPAATAAPAGTSSGTSSGPPSAPKLTSLSAEGGEGGAPAAEGGRSPVEMTPPAASLGEVRGLGLTLTLTLTLIPAPTPLPNQVGGLTVGAYLAPQPETSCEDFEEVLPD